MSTRWAPMASIRSLTAVTAVLALTACAPTGKSREPAEFVPDARLYAQIAEIDHVTDVTVQYSNELGAGPMYDGDVLVDGAADPLCVLDQVHAILWQGRFGDVAVDVVQGEVYVSAPDLDLDRSASQDPAKRQKWIDRYGQHPTAGASPKPSPRPTPPAGGPCG